MLHVNFKKSPCRRVEFKKRPCRRVSFSGLDPLFRMLFTTLSGNRKVRYLTYEYCHVRQYVNIDLQICLKGKGCDPYMKLYGLKYFWEKKTHLNSGCSGGRVLANLN